MSFNNYTTNTLEPDLRTPQGSPLSPILSALVTGPILRLTETWSDIDLTLYVDDGNIFTSGPTYCTTANKLSKAAHQVFTWLHDAGFSINNEKCELMFFHPRITRAATYGTAPMTVTLQLPDMSLITIKLSTSIRYLGIFFTPHLDWTVHIKTMSTRVQSIMKGLGVLGNSIRGFHLINWRRIFISVFLPVLTYGCQVWFKDVSQITLIKTLQVAQNEACRKLAGTFYTTPTDMTQSLLSIPPIHVRLRHLLRAQGRCLASQPPSCLLCHPSSTRKSTLIPSHVPTAPILPPVAKTPPMNPVFSFPHHPASPPWSHPRATLHTRSKNSTPSINALKKLSNITIFLSSAPFHIPNLYLHIFAIYHSNVLTRSNYCTASTPTLSLLLATTSSLKRVGDCPERQEICLFYSDAGLPTLSDDRIILRNIMLRNIPLIHTFHRSIDTLLNTNPLSFLTGHWYLRHWVNAQAREWYVPTVEAAFQATLTVPQTVETPLSDCLLEDWRATWTPPPPGDPRRHFTPLGEPPDLSLHPFTKGVLTSQSCAYQSAAFQLITGHAFDANYSSHFRRNTGDNTTCPHCSD